MLYDPAYGLSSYMSCVQVSFCFGTQLNYLEKAWSFEVGFEALLGETRAAFRLVLSLPHCGSTALWALCIPSSLWGLSMLDGLVLGVSFCFGWVVLSPPLGSVLTCVHWRLEQSGGVGGWWRPLCMSPEVCVCSAVSSSSVLCTLAALASPSPRPMASCQGDH